MLKAPEPFPRTDRVSFELDRFELVSDGYYEVRGRWSGVRGRRFMRPALTALADGQRTRFLADLVDKPWAAEDGQPWKAAFPCPIDGGEFLEAELTVAPDITITLPSPHGRSVSRKKKPPSRPGDSSRLVGDELAALKRELASGRNEQRRLQRHLDRLEADRAQAVARVDELISNQTRLTHELEEVQAAHDQIAADREALQSERAQIAAERDAARRARDEGLQVSEAAATARERALAASRVAVAAQTQALSERDAATSARDQAVSERDAALAVRDHAVSDRDAAVAARDDAVSDRDAAVAARDDALSERDVLSRTNERLQSQLADLISSRGAALVMRRAAQERPASRPNPGLVPGAIAVIVLLAIAVVLMIILRIV